METHYKFRKGEQRSFLLEVASKSGLKIKNLAKLVGYSSRSYRDWLNERYCVPTSAANILSERFSLLLPEDHKTLTSRWKKSKIEAGKAGGFAHFRMYGNPSTPEGRIKGGLRALEICRRKGLIPEAKSYTFPKGFSNELAEFVGIVLGDGGITTGQLGITLNRTADREYKDYVINLGLNLFGEKGTVIERKDCNADTILYSGVNLIKYLLSIGLHIGNKVKQQVSVPLWINDNILYKSNCLKGLMDTDGCIVRVTHKRGLKQYVYFNPCFKNRPKPLISFVAQTLADLGLHPCVAGEHVWLYNRVEVQKYFELVGSSNTRLLRFKEGMPSG